MTDIVFLRIVALTLSKEAWDNLPRVSIKCKDQNHQTENFEKRFWESEYRV